MSKAHSWSVAEPRLKKIISLALRLMLFTKSLLRYTHPILPQFPFFKWLLSICLPPYNLFVTLTLSTPSPNQPCSDLRTSVQHPGSKEIHTNLIVCPVLPLEHQARGGLFL